MIGSFVAKELNRSLVMPYRGGCLCLICGEWNQLKGVNDPQNIAEILHHTHTRTNFKCEERACTICVHEERHVSAKSSEETAWQCLQPRPFRRMASNEAECLHNRKKPRGANLTPPQLEMQTEVITLAAVIWVFKVSTHVHTFARWGLELNVNSVASPLSYGLAGSQKICLFCDVLVATNKHSEYHKEETIT